MSQDHSAIISSTDPSDPSYGFGTMKPLCLLETAYNKLTKLLVITSAIFLIAICLCITLDASGRILFNMPLEGVTDLEPLFMSVVGFAAMTFATSNRSLIRIDLFDHLLSETKHRTVYLYSMAVCCIVSAVLCYRGILICPKWKQLTSIIEFPEWPILLFVSICIGIMSVGFFFQVIHALNFMLKKKEYFGIIFACLLALLYASIPFIYKGLGLHLTGIQLGAILFALLFINIFIGVPLGLAMACAGTVGMLCIARFPEAALATIAPIPFTRTANFMLIALPVFMLMGDMVTVADLSKDLFEAFKRWLGFVPGSLACSSVAGCAGFGAVCGDSMATALAMTSVAIPAMKENGYYVPLSAASLAAGGTLGILIPPSMGFIVYAMITEESVGKLFIAGIVPGLLLTAIFITTIIIKVTLHPEIAPKTHSFSFKQKFESLFRLIPVIILFFIVVWGILTGMFTPAEGAAVGSVLAFFYSAAKRKLTIKSFCDLVLNNAAMFGKMFSMFLGLYIFGAFLGASRLPNLLADTVAALQVNRYVILLAIIVFYIILGCVMNIMPMMMLTLPSIWPTVQALGFDGVWFGVITVIIMEMGMITPPVGINVLAISSLLPDTSSSAIFKNVVPFIFGMLLCVVLLILFPQICFVLL